MTLTTKVRKTLRVVAGLVAAAFGLTVGTSANAALTLNATGLADGFSLSTFYTDPAANYGLLGAVSDGSGNLIGSGYARSQLYKFADVDGQSFGTASLTVAAVGYTPTGIASAGGAVYVGLLGSHYYSVNPTTLALTVINLPGITATYGLWGNPVNGHLLAGTSVGLIDIDPGAATYTIVGTPGGNIDGVTVSPDGKTAYIETNSSELYGYSLISPNPSTPVFSKTGLLGGPDGTGIISGGTFDGFIVVNNNDGTVGLIDPGTGAETIIASGGTRGDLVAPDTSNGTLLLAASNATYRLSCGPGCAIGSGPPPVPEPETYALLGAGLIVVWLRTRRKVPLAGRHIPA